MVQLPRWRRFAIVTYLHSSQMTYHRAPRQPGNDLSLPLERLELNLVLHRPVVFRRSVKHRTLIRDIRVLEREFTYTEWFQRFDIIPDRRNIVNPATGHHAG